MAEIISNQFTTTIARVTQTTTKEIISNQFATTISRVSDVPATLGDELSTVVNIYKKGVLLTPVSGTPTTDEYAVTITGTTGCTATLEEDKKTIKLLTITGNTGRIDVSINIENKETYIKSIPVASITGTQQINSAIIQKADEITSTVSATYATQTTTNSMLSQIQQNADNISTKVDVNGVISSINQSAETISINASKINLNGYVSNEDESWSITNDGLFNTKDMNVDGDVSCDNLTVTNINSPKYPATLEGTTDIYVNSSTGNDDNIIGDEVVFATLQGAIDAIPKFLNGKNIRITLQNDVTENIKIQYFSSGRFFLYLNGHSINGYVKIFACSAPVSLYGGNASNNTGSTGIIHPNSGVSLGSRTVSLAIEASKWVTLYSLKIYASDNLVTTNTSKVCVSAQGDTAIYCSAINIVNAAIGFRVINLARMQIASSSGVASSYGFQAQTGGIISFHNANQAGGVTAATNNDGVGQIWKSSATFASGSSTTSSSTVSSPSTTQILTVKSNYGDTYRSTVYNNWKKDGTARQGNWGYGNCTGCWFFGTAFAEVKGKTISKVTITISRQAGGVSSAVGLVVKAHNYASRPSGTPTMGTTAGTLSLAAGNRGTLTITNSTILNAISSGTVKGFGIQSSYTNSNYAVCSGSVTVKIYYEE